ADRVHLAPASPRAEFEHLEEGIVELRPTALLDVFQQPGAVLGEGAFGQPSPDVRRRRPGKPASRFRLVQPNDRLIRCDHGSVIPRGLVLALNRFRLTPSPTGSKSTCRFRSPAHATRSRG